MVVATIQNVDIDFPYQPYDCQITYMGKVIESLNMNYDAALESPTGTGKTLCLLCAVLGWIQKQKMSLAPAMQEMMALSAGVRKDASSGIRNSRYLFVPRVFYCSRTHSQLAQVVRELNKTTYKIMATAIIGSRDQFCIHDRISKESDNQIKSIMCRNVVSKRTCSYYNQWDKMTLENLNQISAESGNVPDIEEIVATGRKHRYCPFFRNRQMNETAELVLLPYNYLIDPQLRRQNNIDLNGSIIIFDEAHNLEAICEEAVSIDLCTTEISLCIRELKKAIELLMEKEESIRVTMDNCSQAFGLDMDKFNKKDKDPAFNIGTAAQVLNMLFELENHIENGYDDKIGRISSDFPGKVFPGEHLLNILENAQFSADKAHSICEVLQKAAEFLNDEAENLGSLLNGKNLEKIRSFILVVYSSLSQEVHFSMISEQKFPPVRSSDVAKHFKLYMVKDHGKEEDDTTRKITLKYWCFTAGIAMKSLKAVGVRNIIVTSGTLSPLSNFVHNLGINFGCILENSHAAKSDQVLAAIVQRAPKNNQLLNGAYVNRSSDEYVSGIAESLLSMAITVPQGILVFFASYSLMNQMINELKKRKPERSSYSYWQMIIDTKTVVVEPRNKQELSAVRCEFTQGVRTEKGAMFFAVCRGKVSEGIDFADADSRAVCIIGIPYPPIADVRVRLKRLYMDEIKADNKKAQSSEMWYLTEGYRAVNQAIGRVIRHVNDFGIVALFDARFASVNHSYFPSWMRSSLRTFERGDEFIKASARFFRERDFEIKISRSAAIREESALKSIKVKKRPITMETSEKNEILYDLDLYPGSASVDCLSQRDEIKNQATSISQLMFEDLDDATIHRHRIDRMKNTVNLPDSFGAINATQMTFDEKSSSRNLPVRKKLKITRHKNIDPR